MRVGDWRVEQADVASHLDKGIPLGGRRVELELVAAGVRGVEDPKTVLRVGDLRERPGRTVYEYGVGQDPFQKIVLDARLARERGVE